jgi:hypothetical protein
MKKHPRMSSTAGALLLATTGLSGNVIAQDPPVPTRDEMVLKMLRDTAKARHPKPEWCHARHESLGLLFMPLQLMVDLGMNRPWNPLGAIVIDGSEDPIVVTASEGVLDRLNSRLGWLSMDLGQQLGFGCRAVTHGASSREFPTCWSYEGVVHQGGGQVETRFLWPDDGWFDQVHCDQDMVWDSQSLTVCGLTADISRHPRWPGVDELSPRASMSWLGRFHFDIDHQLLDEDVRIGDERIVVRDLGGHVIRDIDLDFDGAHLDRMVIHQHPISATYSLGTIEKQVEGGGDRKLIPLVEDHRRWIDGLKIVIDFIEDGDFRDVPHQIQAYVGERRILSAEFEWIRSGDSLVEPSITPDYGSYGRLRSEFLDAWSESVSLERAIAPRVFSDRMNALAVEVRSMSQDLGLSPAEPLRMLERRFMLSIMNPRFQPDSIEGDLLVSLLEGAYREQVRTLPRQVALAEAIRQLVQNRPLLALATAEALGEPRDLDDVESRWWNSMMTTMRQWAWGGHASGSSPVRGRAGDVTTSMGMLARRMLDGRSR